MKKTILVLLCCTLMLFIVQSSLSASLKNLLKETQLPRLESNLLQDNQNNTPKLAWGDNQINCLYLNPQEVRGIFTVKLLALSPAGEELRFKEDFGKEKSHKFTLSFRVKGYETGCLLLLQDFQGNVLTKITYPVNLQPDSHGGELLALLRNFESACNEQPLPLALKTDIRQKVAQGYRALDNLEKAAGETQVDWERKVKLSQSAYQNLLEMQVLSWKTDNSDNITPDRMPESNYHLYKIDFSGVRNECISGTVNFTNLTPRPFRARIVFSVLTGKNLDGSDFSALPATLSYRQVEYRKLRDGKIYGDALVTLGDASLIDIPPHQTGQLWVTLKTGHLAAGNYHGIFQVKPMDESFSEQDIQLNLDLYPIDFPDNMPIATYMWDNASNDSYVRDLVDHKVNHLLINCINVYPLCDKYGNVLKIDFQNHDLILAMKRKYGSSIVYSYGAIPVFNEKVADLHGWVYLSKPWKKAFKEWIRLWVSHLKASGMDYNDFSIQLWDEASGEDVSKVTAVGPFLREIDPKIRWVMDGSQTLKEAKLMNPYVDIWIPHLETLLESSEKDSLVAFYKSTHKPVWCYSCSINMTAQPVLEYYRLRAWYAWKFGFTGICLWNYNSWRGDSWNDFDALDIDGFSDNGVVYSGENGPVTSRRWETFREGLQDYQCLSLLNLKILKAESSKNPVFLPLARESRILINTAVDDVLESPSETRLLEWREKIIQQLLKFKELPQ